MGQSCRGQSRDFPDGEQTETTLNGLTMIAGQQLADTHSAIALNHLRHGRQLHKCIVADRAHACLMVKCLSLNQRS